MTDYVGLGTTGGHAYLDGPEAAHAILDLLRASRSFEFIDSVQGAVIWGHSQGGGAALWAGAITPFYAPELLIKGVAAIAPATDLPRLLVPRRLSLINKMAQAYVLISASQADSRIHADEYLSRSASSWARAVAGRCLSAPTWLATALFPSPLLLRRSIFSRTPDTGPLGVYLRDNVPPTHIGAPALMLQGDDDRVIDPLVQEEYVRRARIEGQYFTYRTYAGRGHLSLLAPSSQAMRDLTAWTAERLATPRGRQ